MSLTGCENVCIVKHDRDDAAPLLSDSFSTNAVNRSLSDLHTPTWFALLGLAAGLRTVLLHPLNVAISRKRVMQEARPPSVWKLVSQAYQGESRANSAPLRKGLRAVYCGFGAALTGNIIGEVTYLYTLEAVKERLEGMHSHIREDSSQGRDFNVNSNAAAAGGMAGDFVSLIPCTPISVVCNRQMTAGYGMAAERVYRPVWATGLEACNLHQQPNGSFFVRARTVVSGLYAGLLPALVALPASGLWWGLYSKTKAVLYTVFEPTLSRWEHERYNNVSDKSRVFWKQNWLLSPIDNLVLNAMAGMIASAITTAVCNPLDVLHTRLQALPVDKQRMNQSPLFARIYHMVGDLIRNEGWRGFFKGTSANIAVSVLGGVFFSLFFELTKLGSDQEFLSRM